MRGLWELFIRVVDPRARSNLQEETIRKSPAGAVLARGSGWERGLAVTFGLGPGWPAARLALRLAPAPLGMVLGSAIGFAAKLATLGEDE